MTYKPLEKIVKEIHNYDVSLLDTYKIVYNFARIDNAYGDKLAHLQAVKHLQHHYKLKNNYQLEFNYNGI